MELEKLSKINLNILPDPENRFTIGLKIGGGVEGDVFEAMDNQTGTNVAIKITKLTEENEENIKREFYVYKELGEHENFPKFYGIFFRKESENVQFIWLVLELCDGGTAVDFVRKLKQNNEKVSELHAAYILRETIKAVIHLHENYICHRDIRGTNILLTQNGKVKLIDFGISCIINDNEKITTFVGSPSWMAPEMIGNQTKKIPEYDNKIDVWALGITTIELADGQAPFEEINPTRALFQIVNDPPPTLAKPSDWTQIYNDFIGECLIKDPENRPYAQELLEHTLFQEIDNDSNIPTEISKLVKSMTNIFLYKEPEIQVQNGFIKTEKQFPQEKILQEDLASLVDVSEDSILSELYERFKQNEFYTFIGDILLFLNPNKCIFHSNQQHHKYRFKAKSQNAPHIFSVTESAYRDVFHHEKPQNIIFAGETGSGKTENMMQALDHLLYLGEGFKCTQNVKKALEIIHALGNANTPHNKDSTRHILHVHVTFTDTGKVSGAVFQLYELETDRVTSNEKSQANFHIFYYLYEALKKGSYNFDIPVNCETELNYLNLKVSTGENNHDYELFEKNLKDFEFEEKEIFSVRNILMAILLIGQIEYLDDKDDKRVLRSEKVVKQVATLLGLEEKTLSCALLQYCSRPRREKSSTKGNDLKDNFAQGLYFRLVHWIIRNINKKLSVSRIIYGDKHVISLLDFYGFEIYEENSLNQLFVNTVNEILEQHYNQKIFIRDKVIAAEEEIGIKGIEFEDNKAVLDGIMSDPDGILAKLDEFTMSENDLDFMEMIENSNPSPENLIPNENLTELLIKHYAGEVIYNANNITEKNKYNLPGNLVDTMKMSTDKVVKEIFSSSFTQPDTPAVRKSFKENNDNSNKSATYLTSQYSASQQSTTRATAFKNDCNNLKENLLIEKFGHHFVRCIRTDLNGKEENFELEVVKRQLRALAVVNTTLKIQHGYSHNILFSEFFRRYKFLTFDCNENVEETKENCRLLLLRLKLEGWMMGKTKVFLKYYNTEYLTRLYETELKKIIRVQSMMRRYMARKKLCQQIQKYQVNLSRSDQSQQI